MKKIRAEKAPVDELIQQALLKAKYNVNHKINMLLIPQDMEVANILGLPRHLQLKEDDSGEAGSEPPLKKLRSPCFDHFEYGKMVESMTETGLNTIISGYRSICESANNATEGSHDKPDPALDKELLQNLSRQLLDTILGWGADQAKAGKSLAFLAREMGFA